MFNYNVSFCIYAVLYCNDLIMFSYTGYFVFLSILIKIRKLNRCRFVFYCSVIRFTQKDIKSCCGCNVMNLIYETDHNVGTIRLTFVESCISVIGFMT